MKKRRALLFVCVIFLCLLSACAKMPVPTPSAESSTAAPESTTLPTEETAVEPSYSWNRWDDVEECLKIEEEYRDYSDGALLELITESISLADWGLSSQLSDQSIWGEYRLAQECPPLKALLARPSAAESIREYGPALVEKYAEMQEMPDGFFWLYDTVYKVFCPDLERPDDAIFAQE